MLLSQPANKYPHSKWWYNFEIAITGQTITLCSEKNTHSSFFVYLHGKCLDFYKIFRECV